jgi:hypothetical protein
MMTSFIFSSYCERLYGFYFFDLDTSHTEHREQVLRNERTVQKLHTSFFALRPRQHSQQGTFCISSSPIQTHARKHTHPEQSVRGANFFATLYNGRTSDISRVL